MSRLKPTYSNKLHSFWIIFDAQFDNRINQTTLFFSTNFIIESMILSLFSVCSSCSVQSIGDVNKKLFLAATALIVLYACFFVNQQLKNFNSFLNDLCLKTIGLSTSFSMFRTFISLFCVLSLRSNKI